MFRRKGKERPLVPGADPELRPAATYADFVAGWREVTTRYKPQSDMERLQWHVSVMPEVRDWVHGLGERDGPVKGVANVYPFAVLFGTFALYSALNNRVPCLRTPAGQAVPLPEIPAGYETHRTNPTETTQLTPVTWSVANWAHFDGGHADWATPDLGIILGKGNTLSGGGGPGREHIVHAGVHILGALTLLPEGTAMAVREEGRLLQVRTPEEFQMAGDPPFPPNLAQTFPPK